MHVGKIEGILEYCKNHFRKKYSVKYGPQPPVESLSHFALFRFSIFMKISRKSIKNRQHAKRLCFPRVNGVLFSPKSLKSQKCNREVDFQHLFAKVRKRYASNAYCRWKWREMAQKCHLGAKVPFGAISVPGRAQIPRPSPLPLAPGAKLANFS